MTHEQEKHVTSLERINMTDTRKEAESDGSGVKIVKLAGTDETFMIQWKNNGLRHTTFRNTFEDAFSLCKELFNYSKDDKMQTPTESNAPCSITEPSFSPEQIEKIRKEYNSKLKLDWGVIYPSEKFEVDYVLWLEQQFAEAREGIKDLASRNVFLTKQADAVDQKAREFAEKVFDEKKHLKECNSNLPVSMSGDSECNCRYVAQAYLTQTKGEQNDDNTKSD